MEGRALRVFVAAWVALGLAGALDHTIAEKVLGHRVDLVLPELRYGYVMFNVNPRIVDVYEYAGADGARHPLADLVPTPSPGYARARVAVDAMLEPLYLREICYRATRSRHEEFDFFVDQYDVDADPRTPAHTTTLHCDLHGLAPR